MSCFLQSGQPFFVERGVLFLAEILDRNSTQ
jgi:hypothetical protein